MTEKVYIPVLPLEEVDRRFETIKPTYRFKGKLHYIEPVHLHNTAYTWDAKPAGLAVGLAKLKDITTYHSYGYYGFFKPSIGEVLRQIPDDLLNEVMAFEIIDSPQTADDLNKHSEALNDGYHVATTRLYCRGEDMGA